MGFDLAAAASVVSSRSTRALPIRRRPWAMVRAAARCGSSVLPRLTTASGGGLSRRRSEEN